MKIKVMLGIGICILLATCLIVYDQMINHSSHNFMTTYKTSNQYGLDIPNHDNKRDLIQFVDNQMLGEYGVYTNYQDSEQMMDVATGHEVLSESEGLLLRYYAFTKQQNAFDMAWKQAQQTLNLSSGFSYRYSPKLDQRYSLNAAVDDLRIIRALYEAGAVFEDQKYTEEADRYSERFYEYNVKRNYMYDFYDEKYRVTNSYITLCYINLLTLQMFPNNLDHDEQLYSNMLEIIQNGYLSDKFPMYETRYRYDTNSYTSENINTVESLLTILALSEAEQQNSHSIRYLKEQIKSGTLYGQYTPEGTPTNEIQSTAIYAITAMIGSVIGDKELYEGSIQRMLTYQIHDSASPLNGSFGDVRTQTVYSFDNLMALLAFVY
ncbi:glycosyl hydrolase family 8 [Paenibacillus crassostreae]|uniref:Glycosyl hydrolase n=1 Tax=Paenibacillus crassostreae TaxID=1763538 RepID=A0A167FGZ0_9BACL|nr:glycosyl hydrolase family 8 [Paenibacillus crassostreae]AOZ94414.1 hypothetical protein LPB68_20875 [Paenibacillus crassostreae]OAB76549.1 hypothetical protein PNBC_03865 [Paenibacillus crassostreae]